MCCTAILHLKLDGIESTLIKATSQIELNIYKKLNKDIRSFKPQTHQELISKSSRILNHVVYIANKRYEGDIMHPNIIKYADSVYDEIMKNMYENSFYTSLAKKGVNYSGSKLFEITDNGDILYGADVEKPTGVMLRNKYYLETNGNAIYQQLIDKIPSTIMLMMNDLIPYPSCKENEEPIIIYGELYPEGSHTLGVDLKTEINGWRINYKNIDIEDTAAMVNRVIYQTACRLSLIHI